MNNQATLDLDQAQPGLDQQANLDLNQQGKLEPLSQPKPDPGSLEKVYQEAGHWVRLANTVFWAVGAILVPVSFGLVGLALNRSPSTGFSWYGKLIMCVGSISLFAFWVYASSLYRETSRKARGVLMEIERKWGWDDKLGFYISQGLIGRPLFNLQKVGLGLLVAVWLFILFGAV